MVKYLLTRSRYTCQLIILFFFILYVVLLDEKSMGAAQMPLPVLRTPTIILTLMLIVLKRLWTGCCYYLYNFVVNFLTKNLVNMILEYLCGLLSRFAQFFIKPLMSADATMREIKAVDSG